MYILKFSDNSYYTGSTKQYILDRVVQHNTFQGANFTKKRVPVELVYFEEYSDVGDAFRREKQIQNWSRKKKQALIEKNIDELKKLSECKNECHHLNKNKSK